MIYDLCNTCSTYSNVDKISALFFPYGYGMLEMSCRLFVPCPDRPSVGFLINMPFTQIDHRFDCDHHPFFQFYPLPLTAIIRHLRLFVVNRVLLRVLPSPSPPNNLRPHNGIALHVLYLRSAYPQQLFRFLYKGFLSSPAITSGFLHPLPQPRRYRHYHRKNRSSKCHNRWKQYPPLVKTHFSEGIPCTTTSFTEIQSVFGKPP